MRSLFQRSILLLLFAAGIFAGLQLPGFARQYEQRVATRLAEAELALSGFQAIAGQFHQGDIGRLIKHHQQSRDATFAAEAETIYALWKRVAALRAEQAALNQALPTRLVHLALRGNREILSATVNGYSNVVPLNSYAVASGLIGGVFALLAGLIVFTALHRLLLFSRRHPVSNEGSNASSYADSHAGYNASNKTRQSSADAANSTALASTEHHRDALSQRISADD